MKGHEMWQSIKRKWRRGLALNQLYSWNSDTDSQTRVATIQSLATFTDSGATEALLTALTKYPAKYNDEAYRAALVTLRARGISNDRLGEYFSQAIAQHRTNAGCDCGIREIAIRSLLDLKHDQLGRIAKGLLRRDLYNRPVLSEVLTQFGERQFVERHVSLLEKVTAMIRQKIPRETWSWVDNEHLRTALAYYARDGDFRAHTYHQYQIDGPLDRNFVIIQEKSDHRDLTSSYDPFKLTSIDQPPYPDAD